MLTNSGMPEVLMKCLEICYAIAMQVQTQCFISVLCGAVVFSTAV